MAEGERGKEMFVNVNGDVYNTDAIAFVRRLNKPTKPHPGKGAPIHHYVMQLRDGYSLDKDGEVKSVFLSEEDGRALVVQLSSLC